MKINTLLLSLSILTLIIFTSCTPKLSAPLKQIQENQFSTGWKQLSNYPISSGRSDDLFFFDENSGYVINSDGYLSYTADGGENWEIFHENEGTFFRCIRFKNRQEGWLGTIGTDDPYLSSSDSIALYETKDGGKNWSPVQFIGPTPKGLCGLQKVTNDFIVGCGRVRGPSYFIKTNDGGKNWYSYNLDHLAGSLISTHFFDEKNGLLIGGTTRDKDNSRTLVLETTDGGIKWDTIYLSTQKGEYPWKFSFPSREKGFISIQRNVRDGRFYHLQTVDGGKSWTEMEHSESYYYVQGIGFINEEVGWIGGSNARTFETRDGGKTWSKLRDIGKGFNNFQFFNDSIAYGVGFGVFKNENVHSNEKSTKTTYYESGEIRSEFSIRQGKKFGKASTFHKNGSLASTGNYYKNLKTGSWKYYDSNGKLDNAFKMKNGQAKISAKKINHYIGEYQPKNGPTRKIFIEDGQLFSQRGQGQKLIMFPETDTRFFYGFNPDVTIEFIKNKKGEITHSISFQNGAYSKADRIKN